MRVLLSLLLVFICMNTKAQDFKKVVDGEDTLYVGKINFDVLEQESAFTWFNQPAKKYKPNKKAINYLKANLYKYKLVTVLGTWCSDSHDLVPKLYKVLNASEYPLSEHIMIAVDLEKKGMSGEEEEYDIHHVPTFILYKNHKEVGRIVESVNTSVEEDLMAIIKGLKQG